MIFEKHFFRLLVLAALADWLVSRSLARVAIFLPKSPVLLSLYKGLIFAGQYASVLGALLSLLGIGLIAWQVRHKGRGLPSVALASLGLLSLILLLPEPSRWLQLFSLVLALGITFWLGWMLWKGTNSFSHKTAILLPAAAIGTGLLYHAGQTSYSLFRLPGPPVYAQSLFNFGELLVVLTPFCLWWIYGKQYKGKHAVRAYGWGLFGAILFMAFRLANPAMAGILAIWSTGLTLYLPAPIYAVALGIGVATILLSRASSKPTGWVLLLLACAGYASQLSSQIFLGLIALSLLASAWQESETASRALPMAVPDQDISLALGSGHGRV